MNEKFIEALDMAFANEDGTTELVSVPQAQIDTETRIEALGYEFAFSTGFASRDELADYLEEIQKKGKRE